jgi:hypothetical protein
MYMDNLKGLRTKKPLYKKLEDEFRQNVTIPMLEEMKAKLNAK